VKLICNDYVSQAASFAFAKEHPAFRFVMQIDPSTQVASGSSGSGCSHPYQQMALGGGAFVPFGPSRKLRNPDKFPTVHVSGRIKPFAETLSELNFVNCSPILLRIAITL